MRLRSALIAAATAHLLVALGIGALRVTMPRAPRENAPSAPTDDQVDVEAELDLAAAEVVARPSTTAERPAGLAASRAVESPRAAERGDVAPVRAAHVDDAPPAASTSPSASDGMRGPRGAPLLVGPVDLGLATPGARPGPLLLAPSPEPSVTDGARRAIVGALDAHDTDLGVGPGGVVARVTRDWIGTSLAPARGVATFEATTDERGIAVDVRLLDADREPSQWADLARVVMRELKSNPLRVHPGSKGTRVVFRVRSRVRFPSGSPEDGNPVVLRGLGVGKAFDLSDIGAHPMRQVDVFVVSETRI